MNARRGWECFAAWGQSRARKDGKRSMKWPGCAHAHIHPLDMAWTGFLSIHPSLFGHFAPPVAYERRAEAGCGGYNIFDKRPRKRERRENNCSMMPSRRWVGLWEGLRVMRCLRFEEFEGVTRAVAIEHSQSGHAKRLERLVRS